MRTQIGVDRQVPFGGRIAFDAVAGVVGGIVDENVDRAVGFARLGNSRLQRVDIGDVAGQENRSIGVVGFQPVAERAAIQPVEEGDLAALRDKTFGQIFADARGAAGDEYRLALQVVKADWQILCGSLPLSADEASI